MIPPLHQLTVTKLPSAFQMPTISGLLCLLVLKSHLHYFKRPWQKSLVLFSIMLWFTLTIFCCFPLTMRATRSSFWISFILCRHMESCFPKRKAAYERNQLTFLAWWLKMATINLVHHCNWIIKFPGHKSHQKADTTILGIVNYVRDFIPKVAIHTSQLSRMLKK